MDSIYKFVIRELPKHKGDFSAIAKEADVTYSWLRQVASKEIPNPGIKGIERVASILEKRKAAA